MATNESETNKALRSYSFVLLSHHGLLMSGREDDSITDAMESRLSELWKQLDENQRQQARGMSSDLNWIRRGYGLPPKGKKREDVTPEEVDEFYRFLEARDPVAILQSLRTCAAALPPVTVAIARSNAYVSLGYLEMSEPFLKATIDLGIKASEPSRTAFDFLVHVRPAGAFEKSSQIIQQPEKYAPITVAQAVAFVLGYVGETSTAFSREYLADVLRGADQRLDDEPTPHEDRVRFLTTVGAHLGSFGYGTEGIQYLERALKLEPENPELLGWLGEGIYPTNQARAVELFKQSIGLKTRLVRPYIHLANHFMRAKEFDLAKAYAADAAERAQDSFSMSVALEVMAICLSNEGAPHNMVLDLLRNAARIAPGNRRAAANLASFETFLNSKIVATWDTEEQAAGFEPRERWPVSAMKHLVPR